MENQHKIKPTKRTNFIFFVRGTLALFVVTVQIVLPILPALASESESAEEEILQVEKTDENQLGEEKPESLDTQTKQADTSEVAESEINEAETASLSDTSINDEAAEPIIELQQKSEETNVEEQLTDTNITETESSTSVEADEEAKPEESTPATGDSLEENTDNLDGEPVLDNEQKEDIEPSVSNDEQENSPEEIPTQVEDIATTTENVVQPEMHTVLNDSTYTFDINDCARLADGSFYCTPLAKRGITYTNRVFAGPDSEGDSEIFIEKNGVLRQLTFNQSDDAAPFYDEQSETIVFHRLLDARYQIISLDIESGEETQLTFDSYNNMQPSRFGDLIVWQGWVGNDWEIILSDDGDIRMITDNVLHDIGPRINGDYVIWQAESELGWEVRVHNTLTGLTESIDETEGASIENPRLVLVYDAKHGNGDIETRGYDFETGKKVSLGSEAPGMPEQLPDPDQTGEDRALIVTTQQKIKSEDEDGDGDDLVSENNQGTTTASSAGAEDVVVPPFATSSSTFSTENSVNSEAVVEDLVIPPVTTGSSTSDIPDLVIHTFKEEESPIDSQE